jgi:hypothetical protein
MKKLISISIILMLVFLSTQTTYAEMELSCGSGTFGINVANNSPGTNSIYIYGPTNDSAWLDPYSGKSLGPFDAGGSYSIVMYGNHVGSHTYIFNGQSETNSTGWANFSFDCLDSNSSASITYN